MRHWVFPRYFRTPFDDFSNWLGCIQYVRISRFELYISPTFKCQRSHDSTSPVTCLEEVGLKRES